MVRDQRTNWDVLGVDASATQAEVEQAYRRRAFETHPDRNPGSDGAEFRRIAEAYRSLVADFGRHASQSTGSNSPGSSEGREHVSIESLTEEVCVRVRSGHSHYAIVQWLCGLGYTEAAAKSFEFQVRKQLDDLLAEVGRRVALKNIAIVLAALVASWGLSLVHKNAALMVIVGWFLFGDRVIADLVSGLQALGRHHLRADDRGPGCLVTLGKYAVFFLVGLPVLEHSPGSRVREHPPPSYEYEVQPETIPTQHDSGDGDEVGFRGDAGGSVRYSLRDPAAVSAAADVKKAESECAKIAVELEAANSTLAQAVDRANAAISASEEHEKRLEPLLLRLRALEERVTETRRKISSITDRYPSGLPPRPYRRAKRLREDSRQAVRAFNNLLDEARPLVETARQLEARVQEETANTARLVESRNSIARRLNDAASAYDHAWLALASKGNYTGPRPMVRTARADILPLPHRATSTSR